MSARELTMSDEGNAGGDGSSGGAGEGLESMQTMSPSRHDDEKELPGVWNGIQGAIWLIGIAIIAWQGWWWPGILVLVAVSGITQALMRSHVKKQEAAALEQQVVRRQEAQERALHATRAETLPARCPACGAPLSAATVLWRSPTTATCPYCDTGVTVKRE